MERRDFLLALGGLSGEAALAARKARGVSPEGACRIINHTECPNYVAIVGPLPRIVAPPLGDGRLLPEKPCLGDVGDGKRVVIAWDKQGKEIVTNSEVEVLEPCWIDIFEGRAIVTHELR